MPKARQSLVVKKLGLNGGGFVYVTLHRPSNVDGKTDLSTLMAHLNRLARQWHVVFPMHPRTKKMCAQFGISLNDNSGLRILDPIGYHDSLCLTENARLVLTDSGGLQEETTVLGIPCFTLRDSTERPVTVKLGTNTLVGIDPEGACTAVARALSSPPTPHTAPPMWDGKAAERIAQILRGMQWTAYGTNPASARAKSN